MLGMKIGVFEDEEHDKTCFKALRLSYVPNLPKNDFWHTKSG